MFLALSGRPLSRNTVYNFCAHYGVPRYVCRRWKVNEKPIFQNDLKESAGPLSSAKQLLQAQTSGDYHECCRQSRAEKPPPAYISSPPLRLFPSVSATYSCTRLEPRLRAFLPSLMISF